MDSKQVSHVIDQVYIYRSLLSPLEVTDNSGRNDSEQAGDALQQKWLHSDGRQKGGTRLGGLLNV